jgi:hypothetical protein
VPRERENPKRTARFPLSSPCTHQSREDRVSSPSTPRALLGARECAACLEVVLHVLGVLRLHQRMHALRGRGERRQQMSACAHRARGTRRVLSPRVSTRAHACVQVCVCARLRLRECNALGMHHSSSICATDLRNHCRPARPPARPQALAPSLSLSHSPTRSFCRRKQTHAQTHTRSQPHAHIRKRTHPRTRTQTHAHISKRAQLSVRTRRPRGVPLRYRPCCYEGACSPRAAVCALESAPGGSRSSAAGRERG